MSLRSHRIYLAPLIPIGGSSDWFDHLTAVEALAQLILLSTDLDERLEWHQQLDLTLDQTALLYDQLTTMSNKTIVDIQNGRLL